jgi:hypothetical protein
MAIVGGKKGDPITGLGFERPTDTQTELWKNQPIHERRKALLLPALLYVALDAMIKKSDQPVEATGEVLDLLSRSATYPVTGLPGPKALQLTQSAMDVAKTMLDAANPDDEAEAVLVASFLIMKLAEEHCMPGKDYENQALYVAMLITEEAQNKQDVGWEPDDKRMPVMVERALERGKFAGIKFF